ncbi:Hypothetical predicted protein [Mytilus galloprovincialis]|uniref:Uncharacterized protein n=1 Tax=Mytilus galloprovincialis TaxID=29158 RepID=A0A8B6F1D4_MYTGA|nr:Hypothetical predicted protein [Mytilus galloprovincialis]
MEFIRKVIGISGDQRDLKHNNDKNIKSGNSHVPNLNIKSESNEAFPPTNDNSSLSESDINVIRKPTFIENNSLINACENGDLSIVNSLIERGADINITDMHGNTALLLSCYFGEIDIVNLLIDKGCDISKRSSNGMTPLQNACRRGLLLIVVRLIERGADINTTDGDGETPFVNSL